MLKFLFLHSIKDEIVAINAEDISFFGPQDHKMELEPAEFEGAGPDRKLIKPPKYADEPTEITQIHLKNKSVFNIKEKYAVVMEMVLMYGCLISIEKNGLQIHTNMSGGKTKNGNAATEIRPQN